jgi:hypothetical protein
MDAPALFSFLQANELEELGILDPLFDTADAHKENLQTAETFLKSAMQWIYESAPTHPRTVWFPEHAVMSPIEDLPSILKSRLVSMNTAKLQAWSQVGPLPSLLLRTSAPPLNTRGLVWMKVYESAGAMVESGSFGNWTLWTWKSRFPLQRALLLCHHSGVLPDIRRQLAVFGVKGEFVWLCDGKGPTGDAWPSILDHFTSSVPLLRGPLDGQISDVLRAQLRAKYSMIVTSHCMRYPIILSAVGLPLLHINSTRFGNEITCRGDGSEFRTLCGRIEGLLASRQLTVIHNNEADMWYSQQYLKGVGSVVLGSLCDQALRFRISTPPPVSRRDGKKPFLIWDTRFHIVQRNGSKTLHAIYDRLRAVCNTTSEFVHASGKYMDDDMLEGYSAVIHIPYNISTMSCSEQASANIPMWVPTPRFLAEILEVDYSELSWFCFNQGVKELADRPDRVWEPAVVKEYVSRSDFRDSVFQNVLYFDSVEDLAARIMGVDYDALTKRSFVFQVGKKAAVSRGYRAVLEGMGVLGGGDQGAKNTLF